MDNDTPIDLLQVKIEKAKENLSEDTLQAISAVDWKKTILDMRASRGYSFTQLEDLELETELLLCGLTSPDDYPKEVEKRLGLSKPQTSDLINYLNENIFKKIREEFIKITDKKKQGDTAESEAETPSQLKQRLIRTGPGAKTEEEARQKTESVKPAEQSSNVSAGAAGPAMPPETPEKILQTLESEEELPSPAESEKQEAKPVFAQKLSGSWKAPVNSTEYTLGNLSKEAGAEHVSIKASALPPTKDADGKPKADPYREEIL